MVLCALLQAPGGQSVVTQPRIQGYQKRMQAIAHTTSQNAANKDSADALRSMLKDGSVQVFFITITIFSDEYILYKTR